MKTFGETVRGMRIEAGIKLRELARLIHKSPGYLSDVENDRVPPPSEPVIIHIAQVLNVDKHALLSAARKVDPELVGFVAQRPEVADFLRKALERRYDKADFREADQFLEQRHPRTTEEDE